MPPSFRIPLGLALGCAAACAMTLPAHSVPVAASTGEATLDDMFAEYDKLPAGAAKDKLAGRIDAAAHQKYATVSRLYWHVDLAAAKAAAKSAGKPILHLRMLGRLDEDLSCANSRLFRATLYANKEVSAFLRDNFVLYWSSERAVPRVTIDYGDGRKLERTTTGNSAHYVLDENGTVLDVLPGLYAPIAFRTELTDSLALAKKVRGLGDDERVQAIAAYHYGEQEVVQETWKKLYGTPFISASTMLLSQDRVEKELQIAQRATMTKAAIEVADLRYIAGELSIEQWPSEAVAMWASAGQVMYGIGDLKREKTASMIVMRGSRGGYRPKVETAPPPRVLDDQSRALVSRLHDAVPKEWRGTAEQKAAMIARLEQNLVADSALNHLRLRPQISEQFIKHAGRVTFDDLNKFIYADVFRTPKEDAWLGLLPRTDFTGIPGDGVVMR